MTAQAATVEELIQHPNDTVEAYGYQAYNYAVGEGTPYRYTPKPEVAPIR